MTELYADVAEANGRPRVPPPPPAPPTVLTVSTGVGGEPTRQEGGLASEPNPPRQEGAEPGVPPSPDPRSERARARREKAAAKRLERRALRRERTEWLRHPVPVDSTWAKWISGGLVLLGAVVFVWRVSERKQPLVNNYIETTPTSEAATATSGVEAVNPLGSIRKPMTNLAAVVIGSYDANGQLVKVATTTGEVQLGLGRVTDVAGQVWSFGPTDPCRIYLSAPDPRAAPKVVTQESTGQLPAGATPLFDCTPPPTTTAVKAPGAS